MSGTLGIGGPSRATGGVNLPYASDITIAYNPQSGVYTGEMLSRGGLYRVEAWDQATLYSKMDEILQNEYREMTREIGSNKHREFGSGLEHQEHTLHHTDRGLKVMTLKAAEHEKKHVSVLGKVVSTAELTSIILAIMSGDWASVLKSAIGKALEEYMMENKQHGHEHEHEAEGYAVEFGGVMITAATPALLAKKLLFQKNRRIQIIMNNMRTVEEGRLNNSAESGKGMYGKVGSGISSRMRRKKSHAEKSWHTQALNKGEEETGWKGKALNLRNGIATKHNDAKFHYENILWTERV